MNHLIRALAQRCGYQIIRQETLERWRCTEADLACYKAAYERAEAERIGYKAAYEKTAGELSRYRIFVQESRRIDSAVRPFGFLHLQKTGGISLLQFMGGRFADWRTLWVFSPQELDRYHPNELAHYDFICGHYSFRNVVRIRPGRVLCTFLRHPVERVLSCYWYFRTYTGATHDIIQAGVSAAKAKSLSEFLRDEHPEVRFHTANHQTRALSGDWTAPAAAAPTDLGEAVRNLEAFACVGLTERMEQSVDLLCRVMGWERSGPLGRLNETPYRQQVGEISPRELELIGELNSLDMILYEHARERLRRDLDSAAEVRRAA